MKAAMEDVTPQDSPTDGKKRSPNERVILSLLRKHGPLSGRQLAQQTGLSAQAVSVILRRLEADDILLRGAPVKTGVGKPSVPMRINPDGVFSFGLNVGRRRAELVLLDIAGTVRRRVSLRYAYPMPQPILAFLRQTIPAMIDELPDPFRSRICGLGIGLPGEIWNWGAQLGAPDGAMNVWADTDLARAAEMALGLTVSHVNDATAACRAEHLFGGGKAFKDYVYIFLGTFVGGGIVLEDVVQTGRRGNAGAIGSMPVTDEAGKTSQLLDCASLRQLEMAVEAAGHDARALKDSGDWAGFAEIVDPWLSQTAHHLARAGLSACALFDFEAIIIDGAIPDDVRKRLIHLVQDQIQALDTRGLIPPQVCAGKIGPEGRSIGSAAGPMIAQFFMDQ